MGERVKEKEDSLGLNLVVLKGCHGRKLMAISPGGGEEGRWSS